MEGWTAVMALLSFPPMHHKLGSCCVHINIAYGLIFEIKIDLRRLAYRLSWERVSDLQSRLSHHDCITYIFWPHFWCHGNMATISSCVWTLGSQPVALFGKILELLGSGFLGSNSLDPLPVHSLLPENGCNPTVSLRLPCLHHLARRYPF